MDGAIAAGNRLVSDLRTRTLALRRELAAVPYVGTPGVSIALSVDVAARHAALVAAIDATEGLDDAWERLTLGSISATRMSDLLARHDDLVVQAAALGRAAKYDQAMTVLDQADATIAQARELRNQLANTVDVTVLDEWLNRNADYDVALRGLYKAISTVGGRVTDATRKAIAAEQAAKDRLPPDTRGLVVIMAEIGRGGMNGAVIAIEEARGKLIAAIAASAPATPEPGSSAEPGDQRARPDVRSVTLRARAAATLAATFRLDRRAPGAPGGPPPEDWIPCSFASSPISRGTCPRTSSSSRSRRRPPSTAPWPSSTGEPAASCRRSPLSASWAPSAIRPRWRPPASCAPGGSWSCRSATRPPSIERSSSGSRPPPSGASAVEPSSASRSGCRRSPTRWRAAPSSPPGWSPGACSRAPTTRARSTGIRSTPRCPPSTSSS